MGEPLKYWPNVSCSTADSEGSLVWEFITSARQWNRTDSKDQAMLHSLHSMGNLGTKEQLGLKWEAMFCAFCGSSNACPG